MVITDSVIAIREKLTAIADGFRMANGTTAELSLDEMATLSKKGSTLIEDIPTTAGEWACLVRASQMRDLNYVAKGNIPTYEIRYDDGTLVEKGEVLKSLWYSSVRGTDWGFVGYAVSMYSFMTCLNNPKSFIYTRKYHDYFDDGFDVSGNVYGTNCSEFVSYCHDIPYLAVTNTLPHYPNVMDENGIHNADGMCWDSANGVVDTDSLRKKMQLCDFLVSTPEFAGDLSVGHAVMVTGIRRNSGGIIQEVDITHATTPLIVKETHSWESFVQNFIKNSGYRVYRFSTLENVTFPENLTNIVYSDIVTNRGDKISIRPNQDISLNVLGSGYAGIVLFRDGIQVSAQASTDDWELTNLTTGKYTAILYKSGETVTIADANERNSTVFVVCNVSISRTGNNFTYIAEAVEGVYPKPMQIAVKDRYGYTMDAVVLNSDDFNGTGNTVFDMNDKAQSNGAIVHMPFKTEYGFVIAEGTF